MATPLNGDPVAFDQQGARWTWTNDDWVAALTASPPPGVDGMAVTDGKPGQLFGYVGPLNEPGIVYTGTIWNGAHWK